MYFICVASENANCRAFIILVVLSSLFVLKEHTMCKITKFQNHSITSYYGKHYENYSSFFQFLQLLKSKFTFSVWKLYVSLYQGKLIRAWERDWKVARKVLPTTKFVIKDVQSQSTKSEATAGWSSRLEAPQRQLTMWRHRSHGLSDWLSVVGKGWGYCHRKLLTLEAVAWMALWYNVGGWKL